MYIVLFILSSPSGALCYCLPSLWFLFTQIVLSEPATEVINSIKSHTVDSEKRWGLLPSVIEFSRHILVSIESCLRCKRLKVMFTLVDKQQQKDT